MTIRNPLGLYCPSAAPINGHAEQARSHTLAWVQRHGLLNGPESLRTFEGLKTASLMARTYPRIGLEEMKLVTDWTGWLFFLDDRLDSPELHAEPEGPQLFLAGLRRLLRTGALPAEAAGDPLVVSLFDLWKRSTTAAVSPGVASRLFDAIESYFDACCWEADNRDHGVVPDLTGYLEMRELSGAMPIYFGLIELAERMELPASARESSALRRMVALTNHVVCWVNDLFSWHKEREIGDAHNLVSVLQHHERLDTRAAIARVVRMCNEQTIEFVELEQRLPALLEGAPLALVQRYVLNLRCWLHAYPDWSAECERYQLPDASEYTPAA